jgi:hypothetical protein
MSDPAGPALPGSERYARTQRVLAQAPSLLVAVWLADGRRMALNRNLPTRVRAAARAQVLACRDLLTERRGG